MRFLKIFLICFFSLIGVTGSILGVMYLTGYFNVEQIYPTEIAFSSNEYEVEGDFKMMITSPTEDVNVLDVTLSFDGFESTGNIITDGVISLPRYVKIGEEFSVSVVKSAQQLDGQTIEWINGGISSLIATSSNINARKAQAKVYVDVPVYDISIKTSVSSDFLNTSNKFNIDSEFFAKAEFIPERSQYKYSRNTTYGGEAKYKSVFFSTMSSALEKVNAEGLDRYVSKYKALMRADDVQINAQAFKNTTTEENAFENVKNFSDEIALNNLLNILQNAVDAQTGVSNFCKVNFSQLVVGSYSADSTDIISSSFNNYTRIYANKSSLQSNEYSFDANIVATDNQTVLPNENINLALAVFLETGSGYSSALVYSEENQNADVNLKYSSLANGTVKGLNVTLYKPIKNNVDINFSYWEITPIKENLNIRLALVLLDDDGNVKDCSYSEDTEPKYLFQIQSSQILSEQVYWTNPLTDLKTLYIYDGENVEDRVFEEYDLKNLLVYIPQTNTYKEVRYFAYYEDNEGNVDDDYLLDNFIVTTGNYFNANISSGVSANLYEIPNGVLTPKSFQNDFEGKIKVLFATIKTDFSGNVVKVENKYVIDRFSSNSSIGTPQTIAFTIERTLNEIKASIEVGRDTYSDKDNKILAVRNNTNNAFTILFNIPESQKGIFVRDFNAGKVTVDFYLDNKKANETFSYPVTVYNTESIFNLLVSVSNFEYELNDLGYRNIKVCIKYQRGNGSTVESYISDFKLIEGAVTTEADFLHLYDGKIHNIEFEEITEGLKNVSALNPITVTTQLTKSKNVENNILTKDNIFLADVGSNFSVVLGETSVSDLIIDKTSKKIKINAVDKYKKKITDDTNWELVSSDPTVLAVDNILKTISFVGSSDSLITLSVRTLATTGEGNKVVSSTSNLYFKVQTGGQIVKIIKNTTGTNENLFDNLGVAGTNTYTLKDNSTNFSDSSIELEILGEQNKVVTLTTGNNNFEGNILIDILYATRIGTSDNFEVFDLRKILKWSRIDENDFNGFIEFNTNADENITSFAIKKNFGKTGYLNLKIESEIGINLLVKIIINPYINTTISGVYGHENEGANTDITGGYTYVGVYAQKKITVNFDVALAGEIKISPNVVWYFTKQDDTVIQAFSTRKLSNVGDTGTFSIDFTFPDVIGNEKYILYVVLDSRETVFESEYEKLNYDYLKILHFNVNPNVKSTLVDAIDNTKSLTTATNTVIDKIVGDNDTYAIIAERKIDGSETLSYSNAKKPYVYAKITNNNGNVVGNRYFIIENNALKIREGELLQDSQEVYVSLFFGRGDDSSLDNRVATYKFVISPELNEKDVIVDSDKLGFVTYNGERYLQVLANNTYTFEQIANCFDVDVVGNKPTITASFDSTYISQTNYWKIVNPTITVYPSQQMFVGRISVILTIQGVGVVTMPIIITPQLAPIVKYNEDSNQNNIDANADLYVNQTISQLVENEIFDTVSDGIDNYSIFFDSEQNRTGVVKVEDQTYSFYLLDGNGQPTAINFATIDLLGNLSIDFVGEDTYLIVVAVLNNFKIYYRLRIVASLQLESFYPYVKNINSVDESLLPSRAEYVLFKTTDISKTIALTTAFEPFIPATEEKMVISDEDVNITSRFMLFRTEGNARVETKNISGININISSIKRGNYGGNLVEIDRSIWGQYAVVQTNNGVTEIILYNIGNYVVELDVKTLDNAGCSYTIAVEQSNKSYSLVQKQGTQSISNMEDLPLNYEFEITSPTQGEQEILPLNNVYLKLSSGSLVSDRTNEMGYTVVGGNGKLSVGDVTIEENVVHGVIAEYSPNNIDATIIFWNKYGEIGRRNLNLISITKIIDKEENVISGLDFYSGTVVDLREFIDIAEIGNDNTWNIKEVVYTSFEFDKTPNYLINKFDEDSNPEFVLLPLNEGIEDALVLTAKTTIEDVEFEFKLNILVHSGFASNASNSINPVISEFVYAGEQKEIEVFGEEGLFDAENVPTISKNVNSYSAELDNYEYNMQYEILNGSQCIDENVSFAGNKFTFITNAVDSEVVVIMKFTLQLENGSGSNEHKFSMICYYQFVVKPDSDVIINYPTPNGQEFTTEKIHYSDVFDLSKPALFSEAESRVMITEYKTGISGKYVKYSVTQGSVKINGGEPETEISIENGYTFSFEGDSSFAIVEFRIYISDIQRATYSLEIYKNYNSLYSITVNTLNEKDGMNEVFYIAEGRTDIFNGIQALKFNVTNSQSLFETEVRIQFYKEKSLIGEFSLDSSDAGTLKTIKLGSDNNLLELTLENIRFTINGGTTYYTLKEMSEGETSFFTKDLSGKTNFELFTRMRVMYLGIDVTDYSDFVKNKIKLIYGNEEGSSLSNPADFNVDYEGLGGNVTERERILNIVYDSQENNMGTYYLKVKSNVIVENADKVVQITSGQTIDRLMNLFGVVDTTGNPIIKYSGINPVLPEIVSNKTLVFNLDIKDLAGNTKYKYLSTMENYVITSAINPMTYAAKVVTANENEINADFEVIAYGAPNGGLYCELTFSWVYKISEVEEENINFSTDIVFNILPNMTINTYNRDRTENSELNPQVISAELFATNNYYNLDLVDKTEYENSLVYAYKINSAAIGNNAYDLSYTFASAITSDMAVLSSSEIKRTVKVFKPEFSIRQVNILISDTFGFKQTYYIQVQPESLITFVSLSGINGFYEGDSFALKTQANATDVEHEIKLSKDENYENMEISYRMLTTEDIDLDAVSNPNRIGPATILRVKYLDNTLFSVSTKSIAVYFEITLINKDALVLEPYVIKTDSFYLQQRYVSTVIDNSTRDGAEFVISDKISFTDRKIGKNIGEPTLTNDYTLVVKEDQGNFKNTSLLVSAKLKEGNSSPQATIEIKNSNIKNYYMMSEVFGEVISNLSLYEYFVNSVYFKDADQNELSLVLQNGTKLKLNCFNRQNVQITDPTLYTKSFDVLLFDGLKYELQTDLKVGIKEGTNILDDIRTIVPPAQYGIWGIVGYMEHQTLPEFKVEIESDDLSGTVKYYTRLYVENISSLTENSTIQLENTGVVCGIQNRKLSIRFEKISNIWNIIINAGQPRQVESKEGEYFFDLNKGLETIPNSDEKWVITDVNYGFKNQFNFVADKRLDIATIEKYREITEEECIKTAFISSIQTPLNQDADLNIHYTFDGGKLKFYFIPSNSTNYTMYYSPEQSTSTGIKLNNLYDIYIEASKDEKIVTILPLDFTKYSTDRYGFDLQKYNIDSTWTFNFKVQYIDKALLENICQLSDNENHLKFRIFNENANITSDIAVYNENVFLDVSQGMWTNIFDKQEPISIDIAFTGDGNTLNVKLNKNGLQTFSLLKELQKDNTRQIEFAQGNLDTVNGINKDDLSNMKDLKFYNDTVGIVMEGASTGSLILNVKRIRTGVEDTSVSVNIAIRSYTKSYFFGLTDKFGSMPQEGDRYEIRFVSKPSSYNTFGIKIKTPYSFKNADNPEEYLNEIQISASQLMESGNLLVSFEVEDDRKNGALLDNKSIISYDSVGQYENDGESDKKIKINQYYIAKYRGAYYSVKPTFNVTPHFYAINIDDVSSSPAENTVLISDYSQQKDENNNIVFKISHSNWTKDIKFEDINGNVLTQKVLEQLFNEGVAVKDENDNDVYEWKDKVILLENVSKNIITDDNNISDNNIARIVRCSIIDTGTGSATINSNGDIVTTGITNIVNNHITVHIQVAIGGVNNFLVEDGSYVKDENENLIETAEWLDIGSLTLLFNSNQQYSIEPDTSYIISNREVFGDNNIVDTFKYISYGSTDDTTAEGSLSFSAAKLFEDTTVNFSQVSTMIKDEDDSTLYLPDAFNSEVNYQLTYKIDSKTSIVLPANLVGLSDSEKFVMIYGLESGKTITITGKVNSTDESGIERTYENTSGKVLYGKVLLSELFTSEELNTYKFFETDTLKCFVALSKINIQSVMNGIPYYNGNLSGLNLEKYIDSETGKLINNECFNYSKPFELTRKTTEATEVKVIVPANSERYFAVTQNDVNGVVYSRVHKVVNSQNTSQISTITIDAPSVTGLGANKAIILTDITSGETFDFSKAYYVHLDGTNDYKYKISFGTLSENGERLESNSSIAVYTKLTSGAGLNAFGFADYTYNYEIFGSSEKPFIMLTTESLPSFSADYVSVIKVKKSGSIYEKYKYQMASTSFDEMYEEGYDVTTTIGSKTNQLIWHEYISDNINLPNGKLYYKNTNGTTVTSVVNSSKDIFLTDGDSITGLWDGMYDFSDKINNNNVYSMQIYENAYIEPNPSTNLPVNEIYFKTYTDKTTNATIYYSVEKFNVAQIYEGYDMGSFPFVANINFVSLNANDFWDNAKYVNDLSSTDEFDIEENEYYEIYYDNILRAVIYYNNSVNGDPDLTNISKSESIIKIVKENKINKNNLKIVKSSAEKLFEVPAHRYYMIQYKESYYRPAFAKENAGKFYIDLYEDVLKDLIISEGLREIFINSDNLIKFKQMNIEYRLDNLPSGVVDRTSLRLVYSCNGTELLNYLFTDVDVNNGEITFNPSITTSDGKDITDFIMSITEISNDKNESIRFINCNSAGEILTNENAFDISKSIWIDSNWNNFSLTNFD